MFSSELYQIVEVEQLRLKLKQYFNEAEGVRLGEETIEKTASEMLKINVETLRNTVKVAKSKESSEFAQHGKKSDRNRVE